MTDVLEFPYRPKAGPMLAAIAFFGVCTAIGAYAASTNDRGLVINGLIELETGGATTFWWCLTALAAAFVAAGAYGLYRGHTSDLSVRLDSTQLSAPRNGLARQATVVRLKDIQDVGVGAYGKQRWLTVAAPGANLHIAASMLPDEASFDRLHQALVSRLRVGRALDPVGRPSPTA